MALLGQPAPDFVALDDQGRTVRLSDFRGRRVIIFFYPKANTRTCTEEACAFRDDYNEYEGRNAVILGISPDTAEELRQFRTSYNLPYHLIPDPERHVLGLYGVWETQQVMSETGMVEATGVRRISYMIDERGYIMHKVDSNDPERHNEQMLKALDSLPGVAPQG
jgi:thioredoxin-dependent peroxiredoxin